MGRRGALALLLTGLLAPACQLLSGGGEPLTVTRATERGPYLDVALAAGPRSLRAFAPVTSVCRFVLETGARVSFVEAGPAGRFRRRDATCDAVGFGATRIEASRAAAETSVPRVRATFRLLHEDAEFVLLRGAFPLAERIGWSDAADVVAVVPNDPVCRTPVERGFAGMEYRAAGGDPLSLIGRGALCPIVGLARPPR